MTELLEPIEGDIRFLCDNPEILVGRLSIVEIVAVEALGDDVYPEQQALYLPNSLVPLPPLRPVSDISPFVVRPTSRDDARNPANVFIIPSLLGDRFDAYRNSPRCRAQTTSAPGQLTTTPNDDMAGLREGAHYDIGGPGFTYRLAVSDGPGNRGFLVATHSADRVAAAAGIDPNAPESKHARTVYQHLAEKSLRLYGFVVELRPSDIYVAYSGEVIHDGTTINADKESTIRFFNQ